MTPPSRWKLHIVGPDGASRSIPITRDLIVGRDVDADLRLNDSSVSRRHVELSLDPAGLLWIEDLGSGNGVEIDDLRIDEKTKIRPGAKIKLGLYTLTAEWVGDGVARSPKSWTGLKLPGSVPAASEASVPPVDEKIPTHAALRFRTGPLVGKDVPLILREIVIGRIAEGNDIVIPDEAISRHHARLERLGRGYSIRDMQSVNGTAVNGARVVEHMLRAGDRIRMGTIEADYFGPSAEKAKPVDRLVLKRLVLGAVAFLVLFVLWEGVHLWRVHRAQVLASQPVVDDEGASVERSLAEALTARRDENWEQALSSYQAAMAQDPLNRDARKGIKEVQSESQMKQIFDRARQRVDVGQDEEGVDFYLQILASSIYYPRARAEVHRLADLLKRRYAEACGLAQRTGDLQGILQGCGNYLNLVCNSKVDDAKLKLLRHAEQKLGSKIKTPWSCPSTYARWFADDSVMQSSSLEQRIAQKYKNPRLAEVVRVYANGQARPALNKLAEIKSSPAGAHDPAVDQLQSQIALAYGAYTDGNLSLETNDVRNAEKQWNSLFDIDKSIMPDGDQSQLTGQARTLLAKQFYKMGQGQYQQGRWVDAYRTWDQGFRVEPRDDLQQGFISLEHVAAKLLVDGASCPDLTTALQITRDTSLNHRRAAQLIKEQKCK